MLASAPPASPLPSMPPMILMPVPGKTPREVEGLLLQALIGGANPRTVWTKLFVGGLPYHTTDQELTKHFEQYGQIKEAAIILNKELKKSKGYGFRDIRVARGAESTSNTCCTGGREYEQHVLHGGQRVRATRVARGGAESTSNMCCTGVREYEQHVSARSRVSA
ncbi:RNA recognition motif domain [Trinorchestia longiramus]|nr:RNA recognition motif domain [Trinorchestia longiramus]